VAYTWVVKPDVGIMLMRVTPPGWIQVLSAGLISAALFACAAAAPSEQPNSLPTAVPSTQPTAPPTPDDAAEMQRVMDLRLDWGFESDESWVRSVAQDPKAAVSALGILLTPVESEQLEQTFRDDPRSRLNAYGAGNHDEFGGAFVEQPDGTFVMLFTADTDSLRQAIQALIPAGLRVDVRLARFTEAQLKSLQLALIAQLRAMAGVEFVSAGIDTINNVVTLEAKSNDPVLESVLESQHPGMLAVSIYPIPGPWHNRESDTGWRLLAAGRTTGGEAYRVRVATTEAEWEEMWAALDGVNPAPAVDLSAEIALSFGHGIVP